MSTPRYKYIFEDTLTGVKLATIPLYGVNFSSFLNTQGQTSNYGQFTGTFRADTPGFNVQELLDATIPNRTNVWVERSGVLIWAGLITSRVYQSESKSYQLDGQSMDANLQTAFITTDQASASDDPTNLIVNLWNFFQNQASYNYRVVIPPVTTSLTPLYTYSWTGTDYNPAADQITSAVQAGAEYRLDYYYDINGKRTAALRVGRWDQVVSGHEIGSPPNTQSSTLRYPGAISNFWITDSGTKSGTVMLGIGAANGTSTVRNILTNTSALTLGWPASGLKFNLTNITDQTTLNNILANHLQQYSPPVQSPTIKINGSDSIIGTFNLGDYIHIVLEDKYRFPKGPYVCNIRIVSTQITPPTDTSVEQFDVTLDQVASGV